MKKLQKDYFFIKKDLTNRFILYIIYYIGKSKKFDDSYYGIFEKNRKDEVHVIYRYYEANKC